MFKLSHYFSVTSLIIVVIAASVLSWYFRETSIHELTHQGERSNVQLTQAFTNAIWPEFRNHIARRDAVDVEALDHSIRHLISSTPVLRVKILDLTGRVVYSTIGEQIGLAIVKDYPGFSAAKSGRVLSQLSLQERYQIGSGTLGDRQILESYLPIRNTQTGEIEGVFEAYTDVTDIYENIGHGQIKFTLALISIFGLMYVVLFFVVRHADTVIGRQSEEREDHSLQIEKMNYELEAARDRAMEASRSKSQFLANMSHEIRTPLTSIIGFAESLRDDDLSRAEQAASIAAIIHSGNHLLKIINDILDLSKIEANRLEFERVTVSPFDLLADIQTLVRLQAEEKGLLFSVACHYPLPAQMVCDPLRLKQILLNLCGNAVKFTDRGAIKIDVSYPHDQILCFKVTDTGIGLSEAEMKELFQPFAQADASTTKKYGGTGLGLHLSRQLAERMGGTITVTSEPGRGSCFALTITTGAVDPETLVAMPPPVEHAGAEGAAPSVPQLRGAILTAEDNPEIQRLLAVLIKKTGARVTFVANGADALRRAAEQEFGLVLMDLQMPEMDGMEAARRLREMGYRHPIVALTAAAMQGMEAECLAQGFDAFLSKPIDRHLFFAVLARYLPSAPAAAEHRTLKSGTQ